MDVARDIEEGRFALDELERRLRETVSTSARDVAELVPEEGEGYDGGRDGFIPRSSSNVSSERKNMDKSSRNTRLNLRKGSPFGLTLEEMDDRGLLEGGASAPGQILSIRQRGRRHQEMTRRSLRLQDRTNDPSEKTFQNCYHMIRALIRRGLNLVALFREQDDADTGVIPRKVFMSLMHQLSLPFAPKEFATIVNKYTNDSASSGGGGAALVDYQALLNDAGVSSQDEMNNIVLDTGSFEGDASIHVPLKDITVLADVRAMLRDSVKQLGKSMEDVYRMFSRWDAGGTGYVTATQFLRVLARLHVDLTDVDQDFLVELLDTEGAGRINFESLVMFCFADAVSDGTGLLSGTDGGTAPERVSFMHPGTSSGNFSVGALTVGTTVGDESGGGTPNDNRSYGSMERYQSIQAEQQQQQQQQQQYELSHHGAQQQQGSTSRLARPHTASSSRRQDLNINTGFGGTDANSYRSSDAEGQVGPPGSPKSIGRNNGRPLTASARVLTSDYSHGHKNSAGHKSLVKKVRDDVLEYLPNDNDEDVDDDYNIINEIDVAHNPRSHRGMSMGMGMTDQGMPDIPLSPAEFDYKTDYNPANMATSIGGVSRGLSSSMRNAMPNTEDDRSYNDNTLLTAEQDDFNTHVGMQSPFTTRGGLHGAGSLGSTGAQGLDPFWNSQSIESPTSQSHGVGGGPGSGLGGGGGAPLSDSLGMGMGAVGSRGGGGGGGNNFNALSTIYSVDLSAVESVGGRGGPVHSPMHGGGDGDLNVEPNEPPNHLSMLASQTLQTLREMILARRNEGKTFKEIYMHFSRNGTMFFDSADLMSAVEDLRMQTSERVAQLCIESMALDGGSKVSFGEFMVFITDSAAKELERAVQSRLASQLEHQGRDFQSMLYGIFWDMQATTGTVNGHGNGQGNGRGGGAHTGMVDADVFKAALDKMRIGLSHIDIDRLRTRFDIHGQGQCSVSRFLRMAQNSAAWRAGEKALAIMEEATEEAQAVIIQIKAQGGGGGGGGGGAGNQGGSPTGESPSTHSRGPATDFNLSFIPGLNEQIVHMAEYLGIRVLTESHLMWVAVEAFNAPLPVGWGAHADGSGKIYFFNHSTRESRWDHPMDPHFRRLRDEHRNGYGAQQGLQHQQNQRQQQGDHNFPPARPSHGRGMHGGAPPTPPSAGGSGIFKRPGQQQASSGILWKEDGGKGNGQGQYIDYLKHVYDTQAGRPSSAPFARAPKNAMQELEQISNASQQEQRRSSGNSDSKLTAENIYGRRLAPQGNQRRPASAVAEVRRGSNAKISLPAAAATKRVRSATARSSSDNNNNNNNASHSNANNPLDMAFPAPNPVSVVDKFELFKEKRDGGRDGSRGSRAGGADSGTSGRAQSAGAMRAPRNQVQIPDRAMQQVQSLQRQQRDQQQQHIDMAQMNGHHQQQQMGTAGGGGGGPNFYDDDEFIQKLDHAVFGTPTSGHTRPSSERQRRKSKGGGIVLV